LFGILWTDDLKLYYNNLRYYLNLYKEGWYKQMETAQKTAKTVLMVLIINVLSRALALIAGSMITAYYGATAETSAYAFAIKVTEIVTTIIGTALTTAVIPMFIDFMENKDMNRSYRFINNTISLTVITGLIIIAAGLIVSPLLAGFSNEDNYEFTVYAVRVMMPAIIFISLFYIFSGVLQARGNFFMPAMVSLPSSLINITYLLLLSRYFGTKGLVVSSLTGFAMQALILVPSLRKVGFRYTWTFDLKDPDIMRIFKLTGPVFIGVFAYQINVLINILIAMSYNSEKYIVLSNMQNLGIQIVFTLTYAITSVMYPRLSTYAANKNMDEFKQSLSTVLKTGILLFLPITVGFILLSFPIVDIIYGYGEFNSGDVLLGAGIYSLYAIGVIGVSYKEIIDRAFYALKNTKIPAYNGVLIMVVNITLSFILVRFMGLKGIALAYSIAMLTGGAVLIYLIRREIGKFQLSDIFVVALKSAAACVIMGIAVNGAGRLLQHFDIFSGKTGRLIEMLVQVFIGVLVYGFCLLLFRVKEFTNTMKSITIPGFKMRDGSEKSK